MVLTTKPGTTAGLTIQLAYSISTETESESTATDSVFADYPDQDSPAEGAEAGDDDLSDLFSLIEDDLLA